MISLIKKDTYSMQREGVNGRLVLSIKIYYMLFNIKDMACVTP